MNGLKSSISPYYIMERSSKDFHRLIDNFKGGMDI